MHLFFAGLGTLYRSYSDWLQMFDGKLAELASYWELRHFDGHTLHSYGRPFLLDSGAFSAFSQGRIITATDYGTFLQKYSKDVDYYVNLDVIPTAPTEKARLESAKKSWENQEALEAMGLHPLPVYHKGEPIEYLHRCLEYDHFCVGGLVDTGDEAGMEDFFDFIWPLMVDGDGKPKSKVHAFGMTNVSLMLKYPWFSADSTTWMIQSKYGFITMPKRLADGWDFNSKPQQVSVSDDSYARGVIGKHYTTMTPSQRATIDLWINDFHPDVDITFLQGHPAARLALNVHYWESLQRLADWKTRYVVTEFSLI